MTDSQRVVLKQALDELVVLADRQNHFYKQSRDLLYEGLVRAYLWWRDARLVEGFLDEQYAQYNIKSYKQNGEENFTRLLRLIWRLDWTGASPATLQQWSLTLRKLNAEYEKNPTYYKEGTQQKLTSLIVAAQGIRNFIGMTPQQELEAAEDEGMPDKPPAKNKQQALDDAEVFERHFELAQTYYGTQAKPKSQLALAEPIVVSREQYALALVRKKHNDTYDVLDTVSDDALLKQALVKTYKRDVSKTSPVLRLLAEVVMTQSLPVTLEKHRYKLAELASYKDEQGKRVRQNKRLLFRASTQDILLSENRTDCSVVTIAKPHQLPIQTEQDVFMSVNDRRYLENAIIQQRNLGIYQTDVNDQIPCAPSELAASHRFVVTNQVTQRMRALYFYNLAVASPFSKPQATVKTDEFPQPSVYVELNGTDVAELNAEFVAIWLREYGGHITRPKHKLMELVFGGNSLQIRHYGERANFDQISKPFLKRSKFYKSAKLSVLFKTKDLLPVLSAMAEMDRTGKVNLAVAHEYAVVGFCTDLASYAVWVPASTKADKRIKTAFKKYEG